ncbi:Transcription factor Cys6 [Diplocarpon rosae]|nr:Transcription factor Cys6 [Diplocarpon rosae]
MQRASLLDTPPASPLPVQEAAAAPVMSTARVGIERLPPRRMSDEPRESMNCKSCRKRKKRGPKTDVLEALLKRVDGLEQRLKDEKKKSHAAAAGDREMESPGSDVKPKRRRLEAANIPHASAVSSPPPTRDEPAPTAVPPDVLLDTYFSRCHGKAYYVLEESTTRQRMQLDQIPAYLVLAIYAVSARYTAHPHGYHAAVRLSEDYAVRARAELDIDDPSVDGLQAVLLLAEAFMAAGKGKKAHMMIASGIGMAMALELHRECELQTQVTAVEREMRRRLFWTCYLMDRFMACGSRRPALIADQCIRLRLPSWAPGPAVLPVEGDFFLNGSNLQYHAGAGKKCQGSSGMLIDIVRILGITNRYLAAGGVKGDSHFPWHALSNLSKIRLDLDIWASGTQDVFTSIDTLFGQPDSTTLVLSKLIYHLVHCLIYRPFLPIDLAELAGTGQHQSWQVEATNLCFLHANAIAELVELGKQSPSIEWPAIVGYCICTAGTIHVHGTHYKGGREGEVFSAAPDYLSREMQQLSDLRFAWAAVQHQRDTLQTIYGCHAELVTSLGRHPMRYSPVFHREDFFDRYADLGLSCDGAHVSFTDIRPESLSPEQYTGHGLYAHGSNAPASVALSLASHANPSAPILDPAPAVTSKRPMSTASRTRRLDLKLAHRNAYLPPERNPPESTLLSPPDGTRSDTAHLSDQNLHTHQQSSHSMLDGPHTHPHQPPFSPPSPASTFSSPYAFSGQPDAGYDSMFGMSFAYGPGHGDSGHPAHGHGHGMSGGGGGGTPGAESTGTVGTGSDEKDPFLTLMEQLAEDERARGGPGELDLFVDGGQG